MPEGWGLQRRHPGLASGRRAWTADFSPTYFDHPHAPRRVFETLGPGVKLILVLRNPVDRAFSQYRFQKGFGNEREEHFEKALDLEASRVAGVAEKQRADERYYSYPLNMFGYSAPASSRRVGITSDRCANLSVNRPGFLMPLGQ